MHEDINIDKYLEDLQTYLDNGEEEKMCWQEDMQVLISEFKETRRQFKNAINVAQDLTNKIEEKDELLEDFYNSYQFMYDDNQYILIGKKQFRKAAGIEGDINIELIEELEENDN